MPERNYPCEFCDTDLPLEEKRVTLTMRREGRWYIFENVPARVCRRCGHRYYNGPLLLELEKMISDQIDQARPVEAWAFSLPITE
ncbi:MAG: YgiT-type zinc finger protein [Chloroflexi bacterium]|nr:YgiT-type zinc finger protein [Chloroflexota bacterium]